MKKSIILVIPLATIFILTGAGRLRASAPGVQEDPFRGFGGVISQAASQTGVDPNLIAAIIKQSSGFNPKASDEAGGVGLMLITPAVARAFGVSDPSDPQQNVTAGARYLAQMISRFGGDVSKAVAAYNAGPGLVERNAGVPPIPETRNFVSQVLRYRDEFARQSGSGVSPPDLGRWAGEWVDGAYQMTVTVSGDAWSGTFRAEFKDGDPKHQDTNGKITNVRRDGEGFAGDWESSYSDAEKRGQRWGTFKIKLALGATRAADRVVGDWVEKGDEMVKADSGTAMYPGKIWPVDWRRK